MAPATEESLRQKLHELVDRLPPSFVLTLLSEIECMDEEPVDRVRLVRQYMIDYLNRQRTNRARRLFTSLFEAFLIDDEVLYHAGAPAPGMVQRADVGALWEVLSRDGFPLLAVEAQEMLDTLAAQDIIDRVFRMPEALVLRERMRGAALRFLEQKLGNRKALDALLADVSRNRARRGRLTAAHIEKPGPMAAETVQLLHDILAHPEPADAIAERLQELRADPAPDPEALADALLDAVAEIRERWDPPETIAPLLPLTMLNGAHAFGAAALHVRRSGADPARGDAVAAALTAHFVAATRALTAQLAATLRLNERMPGAPLRLTAKDKAKLEALKARIGALVEAVLAAGLLEDRRTEPAHRLAWEAAAKFIATRIAVVAAERASVAASSRRTAISDHADTLWLVGFVWSWSRMARDLGFDSFELHAWRDRLLEEMRANLEKAMRFDGAESLDERMQHLLRIDALCRILGHRVGTWIPASSHNMIKLLTHRLKVPAVLSPEEQEIVAEFLADVRAEMAKTRYWKSNEAMDLLELAKGAALP